MATLIEGIFEEERSGRRRSRLALNPRGAGWTVTPMLHEPDQYGGWLIDAAAARSFRTRQSAQEAAVAWCDTGYWEGGIRVKSEPHIVTEGGTPADADYWRRRAAHARKDGQS